MSTSWIARRKPGPGLAQTSFHHVQRESKVYKGLRKNPPVRDLHVHPPTLRRSPSGVADSLGVVRRLLRGEQLFAHEAFGTVLIHHHEGFANLVVMNRSRKFDLGATVDHDIDTPVCASSRGAYEWKRPNNRRRSYPHQQGNFSRTAAPGFLWAHVRDVATSRSDKACSTPVRVLEDLSRWCELPRAVPGLSFQFPAPDPSHS